MSTHVAFLRAINTGDRRVSNAELVSAARSLGFESTSAYQASGNLLLDSAESSDAIAQRLTAGLGDQLGFDVPSIVRTASEVRAIASAHPFPGEEPSPGSKPQVIFVDRAITDGSAIEEFLTDDDRLALDGASIHWWPRQGVSTSSLDLAGLEAAVGVVTVRTLGTIRRLAEKVS